MVPDETRQPRLVPAVEHGGAGGHRVWVGQRSSSVLSAARHCPVLVAAESLRGRLLGGSVLGVIFGDQRQRLVRGGAVVFSDAGGVGHVEGSLPPFGGWSASVRYDQRSRGSLARRRLTIGQARRRTAVGMKLASVFKFKMNPIL